MTRIFNRKYQKPIRKKLRNNATAAEKLLWSHLKHSQLGGYKFRRQQGIAKYVVDFYCSQYKLAVEIDGATHSTPEEIQNDHVRQEFIEREGVHFLRFSNADVFENMDWVLETIAEDVKRQIQNHPAPDRCDG
jgi:very-short-patch-repair endonuclease